MRSSSCACANGTPAWPLPSDVIVAAHGGVARVLMVLFGVRAPQDATQGDVAQGVVYGFGQGAMERYG